jgi:hypothetical protein
MEFIHVYVTCHFNFSTFNKSLLFVIEYESNRDKNIYRNIILYGGSLGSLFDEERSKVRESNANCRTH